MKQIFTAVLLLVVLQMTAQNSITIEKPRSPQIDLSAYKQIAVGDITGPTGMKTTRSMDITDALTSRLFNSKTYEVVDRNALAQILSSQKNTDIQMIDEKTTSALSKKMNSALLIVGRIQNDKADQNLYSEKQGIVVNGCSEQYYWAATGELSINIKLIDIKTGKMIFADKVVHAIKKTSEKKCTTPAKLNTDQILQDAINLIVEDITRLILPYQEKIEVSFEKPMITFKNPFKKLGSAITFIDGGNYDEALSILKEYATDESLKDKLKPMAVYNYAVGLYCASKYPEAEAEVKKAISFGVLSSNYNYLLEKINDEKKLAGKKAF
jgi:hypothetical protein